METTLRTQTLPAALPENITLSLDETGDFPALIVTGPKPAFTRRIVATCHALAGDHGATIRFNVTR